MDIWKILELDPCTDKEMITDAYREKLMITNPEDKPEEFKKLRAAYEEACAYADAPDGDMVEDTTPLGQWMRRVEEVYRSIHKRQDVTCWQELLKDDLCVGLDTKTETRDRLLGFLMDSFRLPEHIWKLLDDTFDLKEQKEELKETFPEDFINFVVEELDGAGYTIPLELFQGEEYADYDTFIARLHQSTREINAREMDDAKNTLSELKNLDIYHPYYTINEIRVCLIEHHYDEAKEKAEELYMVYPEESTVVLYMGEVEFYKENYEAAITYYEKHLEIEPKSFLGKYGYAGCLKGLGKYEKAKEAFIKILDEYPYNHNIEEELKQINELWIEQMKEKCVEDPDDMENMLELGWSFLQNDRIAEAAALLQQMKPNEIQSFSFEHLSGRVCAALEEYEKALEHLSVWERKIRALPDEVPEELKKDKNRLHLPICLQANILQLQGKHEEALAKVEEALAVKQDYETALELKAQFLLDMERFEEAIEVCNTLEQINDGNKWGYACRGRALFELGYYQAAYDDFNHWIEVYPYDLMPYIYKIRVLIIYDQYEEAQSYVDYLVSQQVESDNLTLWSARLKEETGDDTAKKEAYEMYRNITEKYEKGESDISEISRVYYYMVCADQHEKPLEELLKMIAKGLSYKENFLPLLDLRAFLLYKYDRPQDSLAENLEILRKFPEHEKVNGRIGDIYYALTDYENALKYYEAQLAIEETQQALIDVIRTKIEFEEFDEARALSERALPLDPDEPCVYHNLGLINLYQKRYDEAISYYKAAIEHYEKNEDLSENTHEQLAVCYIRTKAYDKALAELQKVREKSGNPFYYVRMSEVYEFLGRYQEAEHFLGKYKEASDRDSQKLRYDEEMAVLKFLEGDYKGAYKFTKKCERQTTSMEDDLIDYYIIKNDYKKAKELIHVHLKHAPDELEILRFASLRLTWMGDVKQARDLAAHGLSLLGNKKYTLEGKLSAYKRAAVFQAVLGNYDAAFECIRNANNHPLCSNCKYEVCKDVQIILAMIYDIMGDRNRAMDIMYRCASYCKDDTEVGFMIERLSKC